MKDGEEVKQALRDALAEERRDSALESALKIAAELDRKREERRERLKLAESRNPALPESESLLRALHEIAEEWAGAECGEPVTAQEAYAIQLARRMYGIAAEALAAARGKG